MLTSDDILQNWETWFEWAAYVREALFMVLSPTQYFKVKWGQGHKGEREKQVRIGLEQFFVIGKLRLVYVFKAGGIKDSNE